MKSFMPFVLAIVLTSCAANGKVVTKDDIEANLDCIEYKEGIAWNQILEKIGKDYIIKTGDDIWKNTVKYSDKTIILYTDKEGEGVGSKVVVKKIKICKEKETANVKP